MSTQYVVVTEEVIEAYRARGYRLSKTTPAEVLGAQAVAHLSANALAELTVLEIGEHKHETLDRPPIRWRVGMHHQSVAFPFIEKVDLLEEGDFTSVVGTRSGAEYRETSQLFIEKREALVNAAPWIREELEKHRRAVTDLEEFLKANEL